MNIIPQITYTSVLAGITNLEERNEAFHALDDQSKRLEIAWDALQLVTEGIMRASFGTYWGEELDNLKCETPKQFQELLVKSPPNCEVCQRGLLMVSTIRLGNSISPYDIFRDEGDEETIKGFSILDFKDMENEFEMSIFRHPYYPNTNEKLANICCNVLVNGNFNTLDKTDYLKPL